MLKQAKQSPDFANYLCFLLTNPTNPVSAEFKPDVLHSARSAGGIMLKNDIRDRFPAMSPTTLVYVKSTILTGLTDSNAQIRNFAGNVITELVRQAGFKEWPEALPQLLGMVGNQGGQVSPEAQEGAMSALFKVCEDNKKALCKNTGGQRLIDHVIPKLFEAMSSPLSKVRANVIASLSIFIVEKAEYILKNLDEFMTRLFSLATDSSDDVRKYICRAVVQIAEVAPEKIAPHMEGLVSFMLAQQRNEDDPDLALDAAEFWLCVGEDKQLRPGLGPYLPSVVPVLLQSMIYGEDDVLRLEAEVEDAEAEDRKQDIKPQFATSKAAKNVSASAAASSGVVLEPEDLEDGEVEDYDDDDDEDDPEEQWNLRKCSAAALDVIASVFHEPVFQVTLPFLKENFTHAEWPNREAAVLAIGAIADGCMEAVAPNLPDLIPYLIGLLSDPNPMVRQITCWSLGRYSGWAAHLDAAGKEQFFLPMMDGILQRMLDGNKRVQEAAASAFANLEERSGSELENPKYCEVIARQFAECFEKYKDRNMFILYDCVQTLAEHVGATLQSPELVHTLMPSLMKRWEKVSDESLEIFPLNECLSYVASALGNTFIPYAEPIFFRSARILVTNLQAAIAAAANPALDEPNPDFLVTALDLLSSIIQAVGPDHAVNLITRTNPNLFQLLSHTMVSPNPEVRQSAYALLGDTAIYAFPPLVSSGHLDKILQELIAQLDLSLSAPFASDELRNSYAVTNNACWSAGEIVNRAPREVLTTFIEPLATAFWTILQNSKVPASLHENAAIALGRLGGAAPDVLAPHLATFIPLYLREMSKIGWTEEKAASMEGMSKVVLVNPGGLEQSLLPWVEEISRAPAWIAQTSEGEGGGAYGMFKQVSTAPMILNAIQVWCNDCY